MGRAAFLLRALAGGGLACMVSAAGVTAEIVGAQYANPVTRYEHGALGPNAEWGSLIIEQDDGVRLRANLPDTSVFEDIAPRVADLDGDGKPEVIVVESDLRRGSQIALYRETGKFAETAHIGRSFRWLAPVGIGDLDGDGMPEIAYIETPHVGPVLKLVQLRDGALLPVLGPDGRTPVAGLRGLSNHRNGESLIQGGIADCGSGPAVFTADSRWRRILATRLIAGKLVATDVGRYDGPLSLQAALACAG